MLRLVKWKRCATTRPAPAFPKRNAPAWQDSAIFAAINV